MFLKQTFWEENNMKEYVVYGNYTMTKELGRVKANSKEEAVDKIMDTIGADTEPLCHYCARKFVDDPILDEETINAEEV